MNVMGWRLTISGDSQRELHAGKIALALVEILALTLIQMNPSVANKGPSIS